MLISGSQIAQGESLGDLTRHPVEMPDDEPPEDK
jgi:hypothetical protein